MLNRRGFLRTSTLGGLTLGGMITANIPVVSRPSSPSNLKITDLRYVTVKHLDRPCSILRIDTNQDIYGYGEVRDEGDVPVASR
jgi:hypothetical protein